MISWNLQPIIPQCGPRIHLLLPPSGRDKLIHAWHTVKVTLHENLFQWQWVGFIMRGCAHHTVCDKTTFGGNRFCKYLYRLFLHILVDLPYVKHWGVFTQPTYFSWRNFCVNDLILSLHILTAVYHVIYWQNNWILQIY